MLELEYLDKDFFLRNSSGRLLTPEYDYDIEIFAAGIFDAYDSAVYKAGEFPPINYIKDKAFFVRGEGEAFHVLALSTCCDDMTDNRTVVFCELTNKRKHR